MRGYYDGVDVCSDENGGTSSQDEEPDESASDSAESETGDTGWGGIFSTRQIALYSSCAQLVDDDGSLTSEGERALGSIRSGALLAGGAGLLPALGNPVTPGIIIRGLDALEEPTGCGGIVKMDILHQSATWVQY